MSTLAVLRSVVHTPLDVVQRHFAVRSIAAAAIAIATAALVHAQHPDDVRWQRFPVGPNGSVYSVASFGGDVLVGGSYTAVGSVPIHSVSRYNGTGFSVLDGGILGAIPGSMVAQVSSLWPYSSVMVVAGSIGLVGGNPGDPGAQACNGVATWNGTTWTPLPFNGFADRIRITALTTYNGKIVASGGDPILAQWNGTSWGPIGSYSYPNGPQGQAWALTVYNGDLIVGSESYAVPGSILRWNGSSWSGLGSGLAGSDAWVRAMAIYNGELIVGGSFTSAGGVSASNIARWNGTTWAPLGSGLNAQVRALTVLHNKLFAGGVFTQAGGTIVRGVAQWNGSSWAPLGSGTSADIYYLGVNALAGHGDQLVVGGDFVQAGGQPSQNLAIWNDPSDTLPPQVTITAPVDGARIGSTAVGLCATIADASATTVSSVPAGVSASLAAGGGVACGTVPLASEGANVLAVRAIDAYGNQTQTSVTVVRDTVAPVIQIDTPVENAIFGTTSVTLSVTVADAGTSTLYIEAQPFPIRAGGEGVTTTLTLTEGAHTIQLSAVDSVGNATQAWRTVVVDLSAPLVTILDPDPNAALCYGPGEEQVPVMVQVQDLTATTVTFGSPAIEAAVAAGGGIVTRVVTLTEGLNAIDICALDQTGSFACEPLVAVLDTTAPSVALVNPVDGASVRGAGIEISCDASDAAPGSGVQLVEVFLDGATDPAASFSSEPYSFEIDSRMLADGVHTLIATATDGKGNTGTSTPVQFVVDNTEPALAILAPTAGTTFVSGTIEFEVEASDGAGSGITAVTLLAGGEPPLPADPSFLNQPPVAIAVLETLLDTSNYPDGPLTLSATAVDAAGNSTTAETTVTVDNAVPPVCVLDPSAGSVVSGVVPIEAFVDGAFTSVELRVDGVTIEAPTSSPLVTTSFDTRTRLDGPMLIEAVIEYGFGHTLVASSAVTVDNLSVVLTPGSINAKPSAGNAPVHARIEGASVGLLLPTETHGIQLRILGGSPVASVANWSGDDFLSDGDGDGLPELTVRFDRSAVSNVIQAGIACGTIERNSLVRVDLWADATGATTGVLIGSAWLRVTGTP